MRKVLIVGGVAGGASTAARLRRMDEEAEIILFERGKYISFANCGLPYYIGDVITEREKLLVVTSEMMRTRFNIDVRTENEVTAIDRSKKAVTVRNLATGEEYTEGYDKLVLSPGAAPIRPPLPGMELPHVFTLRSIPDTDTIKAFVDEDHPKRAVVVGGGFIGVEMAENLHERGLQITMIEMLPQVLTPIDFEMAALVHQHLRMKHVRLAVGDGLKAIEPAADGGLRVLLQSGASAETDLVILCIGVRPENALAKEAGLELGLKGAISVNEAMQTTDPDIYAIGDAVQVTDWVSGKPAVIPLAGPANRQGRLVADHIVGRDVRYKGTQGTAIVKVFDLTVASTGLNARQLDAAEIAYTSTVTHSPSHSGYYPGSVPMTVKLLWTPEQGKVLGAQIVGVSGVDKRIDVLATALRAGMTVYDLEELELAYAPPYGSAKDPVNMAGFVAANVLRGDMKIAQWSDVEDAKQRGDVILDVRTPEEFELGCTEGAINIHIDELRDRLGELPKDKRILVYCAVGLRAYIACRILTQKGYDAYNITGGCKIYEHTRGAQSNFDTYEHASIDSADHIRYDDLLSGASGAARQEIQLDACGLQCPGPILRVYERVQKMHAGDELIVQASDPGFASDIGVWCERTGHELVSLDQEKGIISARIRVREASAETAGGSRNPVDSMTMVVFSGELDRAMAAFIIANGAAAMGKKVTMFFTFWGLNVLRRGEHISVKKSLVERMFGKMMPRGAEKLKLSNMHMAGMGTAMMKSVMTEKHVSPLSELIETAIANGVRLVGCQMTMDLMGIKQEELLDGVELGGVATFIGASDDSNTTLFI